MGMVVDAIRMYRSAKEKAGKGNVGHGVEAHL